MEYSTAFRGVGKHFVLHTLLAGPRERKRALGEWRIGMGGQLGRYEEQSAT